jgi:hypothetical protein
MVEELEVIQSVVNSDVESFRLLVERYAGPAPTVWFGLLALAATLGVVAAAAVDAYRLALRTRADYEPKTYNRPSIYLLIGR